MKIPPHAKKVFSGIIHDVYQWEQEVYDGTTQTFEGLKRADTIEIIAVQGDEIIISEQEQPLKERCHSLFGGRAEEGELPLEVAKRELREESGLVSDDWELYATYESQGKIVWTNYFYLARNCQTVGEQELDPGEKITIKPVAFDEFVSHVLDGEFWVNKDFVIDLFRIKDKGELPQFKQRLGL